VHGTDRWQHCGGAAIVYLIQIGDYGNLQMFLRIEFDPFGSAAMNGRTVNFRHQFL
jgi:hypothetical protein